MEVRVLIDGALIVYNVLVFGFVEVNCRKKEQGKGEKHKRKKDKRFRLTSVQTNAYDIGCAKGERE